MSDTEQPPRTTAKAKELAGSAAHELLTRAGADSFDAVLVLGSGWAGAVETLGTPDVEMDATELPGFHSPSAPGHAPAVYSMWVSDKRVAVFTGRVHLYEGYSAMDAVHPVRTGIAAGARTVVLTGSVGSLRADISPGQPVVLRDHINMTGHSPLVGTEFVDLSGAYDRRLRTIVDEVDASLAEGVYAAVSGAPLQTPAELNILLQSGADVVGRSVPLETIAAVEAGADVLGLAMVSNDAMRTAFEPFDSERALKVVTDSAHHLGQLLNRVISRA